VPAIETLLVVGCGAGTSGPFPAVPRRRLEGERPGRDSRSLEVRCVGALEIAQQMATNGRPRTTKLYGRTHDQITLGEVAKIVI
jgi:hypothetical protein